MTYLMAKMDIRIAVALALTLILPSVWAGELTYEPGASNGLTVAPVSLFGATDLSGLGSGACVTSTGSALTQTSTQQSTLSPGGAIQAWVDLEPAGAFTPTAGGYIAIYLSRSSDGGSNYETRIATCSTTQGPFQRAPDFVIPLVAAAVASGNRIISTLGVLPPGNYQVVAWNNAGVALSANNHVIKLNAFETVQH